MGGTGRLVYLDGHRVPLDGSEVDPGRRPAYRPKEDLANSQWPKASAIDYDRAFYHVATTAIRIIGSAGSIEPDEADRHLGTRLRTAVSESSAYEE